MLTLMRTAAEFESKAASRGYPLRFATLEEEVGFWGLLALLNFGSGFRVPLHQARNRVRSRLALSAGTCADVVHIYQR